ncbi:helix-turn-helix domain-containing protein, partial [Thorsellia kenyensis]
MSYNQLSLEDRHYIYFSLQKHLSLSQIAKDLGRSQSTISREVKRNKGLKGYRFQQANNKAIQRHKE